MGKSDLVLALWTTILWAWLHLASRGAGMFSLELGDPPEAPRTGEGAYDLWRLQY